MVVGWEDVKNYGQISKKRFQGADEFAYPDILAMLICIIMVIIVGAGLKNSMMLNNILNLANMVVWVREKNNSWAFL